MEIRIQNLHNQAVNAALAHDWDKAIELNNAILAVDSDNLDAILGLAFVYMQLGDLSNAKKYYREALKIDPTNIIARNNADKIAILSKHGDKVEAADKSNLALSPETFMNIKGKTRAVVLANVGQAEVIAQLKIGEIVFLKNKKRRLEVRNKKEEYIGCLPDDISKRLIFFLEAKSEYEVIIKEATRSNVEIFIREIKKGARVKNFISFPDNIQEDMKRIIGKDDDEANVERIEYADDDELEEEPVDDIDKLAGDIDGSDDDDDDSDDDDNEFLSQIESDDDDDDDDDLDD